jgi:putative chitinase
MITRDQAQRITGDADTWLSPLAYAMSGFAIDTDLRIASFLAQCAHESAGFKRLVESLHYSGLRLFQVFPKYFPTVAEALTFAYDDERIAERVYGGRLGNDPEGSGDGYRFRGRGLIQITGRANYRACSRGMTVDIEVLPDLAAQPLYAAQSAAWFWSTHGCNELADRGDFEGITRRINGGLNGFADRQQWLAQVEGAMA